MEGKPDSNLHYDLWGVCVEVGRTLPPQDAQRQYSRDIICDGNFLEGGVR